jgi:hypothetical protein
LQLLQWKKIGSRVFLMVSHLKIQLCIDNLLGV